jgi:hypothetical protein
MNKKGASKNSRFDWKRPKAIDDKDTELSGNPELTPGMFARVALRDGLRPAARKI